MGTNPDTGTSVSALVQGLNRAAAGSANYAFQPVPDSPSSYDVSTFFNRLQSDVDSGWPVVGSGEEVAGYAHLNGHPMNETIYHHFVIGGYDAPDSSVYYADSATTIWKYDANWHEGDVPPFSWYDLNTMVLILGDYGYTW